MIVLDTDTFTLLMTGHSRTVERRNAATEEIAITVISRVEVLRGRFDTLMKAADGAELQRGQQRLDKAEHDLAGFRTLRVDAAAAAEFDRLRQDRKLKKIGRADLLIAAITLANRATLVTRNLRHFRQVGGLAAESWAD